MKKNLLKSIIIMMVAFASIEAGAQNVINSISTNDTTAVREYLVAHPTDTIRSRCEKPVPAGNDLFLLGTSVYLKEDTIVFRKDYEKSVKVVDMVLADRLFEQWLGLNLGDSLLSGHIRDYGYISEKKIPETAADTAMRQLHEFMFEHYRMDTLGVASPRDIRYPKWAKDKYGWAMFADGTWIWCQERTGWVGNLGISYDTQNGYWKIAAKIGYGRSVYSDNAVHDGDHYYAFSSEASIWLRPWKLDDNDLNRLFVGGGVGYERYKTDSKAGEFGYFRTKSNYIYPHAGVQYERRFPKWGFNIFVTAEWRPFRLVYQNEGGKDVQGGKVSLGLTLPRWRHPFKTTRR